MPDVETAWKFRKDVYAHMGVNMPTKPPRKVLFWLRSDPHGRSILNENELFQIAESYNLSYTCVFPWGFRLL
jgi:hypothetical protein